ncbi:MAG: GGDEF domain-containing protein [Stagnimonas sp.]|nr:GGDEF domain-containing protein [Stagnimonas sp.]
MNSNHSKLIELRDLALQNLGLPAEQSDYNLARIIGLAARAAGCRDAAFLVQQGELLVPISETASAATTWPRLTDLSLGVIDSTETRFGIATEEGGVAAMSYGVLPVYSPDQRVIGVLVVCGEPASPLDDAEHFRLLNAYVRLIEDSLLLRSLSIRDPLTNLFNRRYLEQQSGIEWRRAMRLQVPLSFAAIDVDHFKRYNDSAGHHAGDLALVRLAELISAQCRRGRYRLPLGGRGVRAADADHDGRSRAGRGRAYSQRVGGRGHRAPGNRWCADPVRRHCHRQHRRAARIGIR